MTKKQYRRPNIKKLNKEDIRKIFGEDFKPVVKVTNQI